MKHPKKYHPIKKLRKLSRAQRKSLQQVINFWNSLKHSIDPRFALWPYSIYEESEKILSMLETSQQYETRTGTPYVEKYKWSFQEEKSVK